MNSRIRELLIGYVLGALDDDEQSYVEQQLLTDVEWQSSLEHVRTELRPLADTNVPETPVPTSLAERTCDFVERLIFESKTVRPSLSPAQGAFTSRREWSLADWATCGAICAVAVLLFFPVIQNSRFSARLSACQNNLRQLGVALNEYSEYSPSGQFPMIAPNGNQAFAGVYAPTLVSSGRLPNPNWVVCPDSDYARDHQHPYVASLAELEAAKGAVLWMLQQSAGGSYCYNIGYLEGGELRNHKNRRRTHFVIMADTKLTGGAGRYPHGRGCNLLYEDGRVECVDMCMQQAQVDDPYCNRLGFCAPGVDPHDSVVAPSGFRPRVVYVSR